MVPNTTHKSFSNVAGLREKELHPCWLLGSSSGEPVIASFEQRCLCVSGWLLRIQIMLGGHGSSMQINSLLLKSPLFCSGVIAEPLAAETPAVVREALEQQARDRP